MDKQQLQMRASTTPILVLSTDDTWWCDAQPAQQAAVAAQLAADRVIITIKKSEHERVQIVMPKRHAKRIKLTVRSTPEGCHLTVSTPCGNTACLSLPSAQVADTYVEQINTLCNLLGAPRAKTTGIITMVYAALSGSLATIVLAFYIASQSSEIDQVIEPARSSVDQPQPVNGMPAEDWTP